jgi:alkylation response protein AidB-like acyl-CoA dehydrogenase
MGPATAESYEQELRSAVRDWVTRAWHPDLTLREWWRLLAESGWGFPGWPAEWFGKGMPAPVAAVVRDELAAGGVIGPPSGVGPSMGAPALFLFGSEEQCRRWIPRIAYGEEFWAQFFSEPDAGSDLGSVQTRAVRDGGGWTVNGQKVWNSGTQQADRALLVARTDVDVPKHKGITFFVIDLDQSGVDVRPIKQMNGAAEFNETFLTDAWIPDTNRLGSENGGWAVAMAVLSHERSTWVSGGRTALRSFDAGAASGFLDRPVGDLLAAPEPSRPAGNALPIGTIPAVVELARAYGRLQDPLIRQRIAGLHALGEALRFTAQRGEVAASAGRDSGPESSVAYLGGVKVVRLYRDLVAAIAGADALLGDNDVSRSIITAPAHGIQGGSEQIQCNVIGERLLGLPREPQVDRDVPFRELKVGTQRDSVQDFGA